MSPQLYAAQREGVERFLASNGRYLLTYSTGCGKTAAAIRAVAEWFARQGREKPLRILIVCPAIVRRHWVREFKRWAGIEAAALEVGRTRKLASKPAAERRAKAYACPAQAVSYDLLANVRETGWDAIIFDEIHHLADANSRQSRLCATLVEENPKAVMLGLSATLIPTDVKQLWHPLYMLFGEVWGKPNRTGGVSWDFARAYCQLSVNDYGTAVHGANEENMPTLRKALGRISHRLTREDIADDLPAVDISMLELPGAVLDGRRTARHGTAELDHVVDWYKSLPEDICKAVVLVYHRELAEKVAGALTKYLPENAPLFVIDGSTPPAQRQKLLDRMDMAQRCVLVATTESIREGIRLMWAQKVLFAEWRQSPAQVVQVLGRFQSVGDRRRPQIQVLTDESLYEKTKTLVQRVGAINQLMDPGASEHAVEQNFRPIEMSEERIEAATRHMLATLPPSERAEWSDTEGDDDAW